jgi:ACS family hexuronate transporter-like MFS transporter
MGPPLLTIYLIADVGSIGGGWISSHFLKKGWAANRARKLAMLICALCVTPIMFAASGLNKWTAVLLIGLAAAAHQGWSANLFTLASDMFPRKAVGSVVGIGGMAGAVGGMFMALLVGALLEATGGYVLIFIIAGSAYLVALTMVHLMVPRLEQVHLS